MRQRQGTSFISTVDAARFIPGIWDPFAYRTHAETTLGEVATIRRPRRSRISCAIRPLEYRDIPKGAQLTYDLGFDDVTELQSAFASPGALLFGTMRAYLGNVVVTPEFEWLGFAEPLVYPVKSEFVEITPHDSCTYFWWSLLRSPEFCRRLPLGGGGTRPRLDPDLLAQTPLPQLDPVKIQEIDTRLRSLAKQAWEDYTQLMEILRAASDNGHIQIPEAPAPHQKLGHMHRL
jgi:hypothetical protein